MLLAIEKYGLIKGVTKGLKRIWKCKHPNGGVDYP
jgi:putative component of membrane protein insertase Oxa1/YidC/SpoIIIJ protein YidD